MLNLDALRGAALQRDPFDHLVVPRFIEPDSLKAIEQDFPAITAPGSYPLASLRFGPAFDRMTRALQGDAMADALGERLGLPLREHPTMITVRGMARAGDGKIHRDSGGKLATVLLYLNEGWSAESGRLRLLRSADDIESYAVEVPPDAGTLLAFPCTEDAWHGHKPFEGPRRSLQLNWVRSATYLRKEQFRHRVSAFFKRARFG